MKKLAGVTVAVFAGLLAVVMVGGLCGCEKNDGDGIRFLALEPSTATVGTNILWFTITVVDGTRELSLPLEWSVQNSGIGFIRQPTAGLSATYQRTPNNGINIVTVRDQYGVEGYCHINQVGTSTGDPTSTSTSTTSTTTSTSTTSTTQ